MKKRVVLVGIHYPFAILSYFREALEFREDIELCTVGPYTGNWIPWAGGMTLAQKYVKNVDIPLPMNPRGMLKPLNPKLVENSLPWEPDLWLNVDAGYHLSEKPSKGLLATVATDSHVLNYDQQRNISDYFFNMHEHYSKDGDLILPYCYSPRFHKPLDVEKIYDACIIGLHYDTRNQLVDRLRAEGLNVHYSIGKVFDEYNLVFNQSKVGINWASMYDLNARAFELLAMKVPSVQWHVPDADKYFDGVIDYLKFTSLEEAVQKIVGLVSDIQKQSDLAQSGYMAVQGHTYDARIQTIFETVGLE